MNHKLLRIILSVIFSIGMYNVSGVDPVTPNASPEARALLNYIYSQYGKKTLSGQMWAPWGIDETKTIYEITGKYLAGSGNYHEERWMYGNSTNVKLLSCVTLQIDLAKAFVDRDFSLALSLISLVV